MGAKATSVLGILIVLVGALSLLANLGVVDLGWENSWPFMVLGAGAIFEFSYFVGEKKSPGLLVPGGILTVVGLVLTICVFSGWNWMEVLWPLLILAPATGLFQLYWFGEREPRLLIPIGIFSVVGLIFLVSELGSFRFIGSLSSLAIIGIGLLIVFGGSARMNR